MDLHEFFKTLPELQKDNMHPEFDLYVRTFVRSRFPEIHAELAVSFRKDEAEIYAHQQTPQQTDLF